jgi:hypothetical protein
MDCPICFDLIKDSCVGPCLHHFCYACLTKWISFGGYKCPKCKQFIYEIKFDREFDIINNPDNSSTVSEYTKKINIDFNDSIHPGITISSSKGPGVKITKLNKNDKCYKSGLRVNDVIIFLNNVPCNNHSDTILVIDESFEKNKILCFELLIFKIKN